MIARRWRGATRTAQTAQYLEYLEATGLKEYRATPGNLGTLVLTRQVGGLTEFVILSFWDSMESVGRFAGPEPDKAVYYPEDDRFLVEKDLEVQHYEVVSESWVPPTGT
jgi:heme-degrading monooxygenase HmoA